MGLRKAVRNAIRVTMCAFIGMGYRERVATPNDPKLSDGGAWRGSCECGAKKEETDVGQGWLGVETPKPESAATVTRGAVRCSAWLGVTV